MKRTSKAIIAIGFIVCAVLPYFFSGTAAFDGLETAEVTQALPEDGKYFYLNIFTGDDVIYPNPGDTDGNLIQMKKDWWYVYDNVTTGFEYEMAHQFNIINTTYSEAWNVYSSCWGYYTHCNESYEMRCFNNDASPPTTTVKGGYTIIPYNDNFYTVQSNTTLYAYQQPLVDDFFNYSIDPYMSREFNVSTDILISKTNLTAYLINGSEWIEVDNPLYFNASILSGMSIGDNITHNAINYTLVSTDHYYELRGLREPYGFSPVGPFNSVINKTVIIRVRKNGEIWGYGMHKHYHPTVLKYNQWLYGSGEAVAIKTEENMEFWFGDHYYENGGYFTKYQPNPWREFIITALIIGAPAVVVVGAIVLIRKKLKKKGG